MTIDPDPEDATGTASEGREDPRGRQQALVEAVAARDVRGAVLTLLARRAAGATLCPSEVARRLAGEGGNWRVMMPAVHAAVDGLVAEGAVRLSWKGVALSRRDGPYRIARPTPASPQSHGGVGSP